jgi:hypothetical protein
MQYSLLSQESPSSIKTLRLEIGLCHEKKGAPRFCLTYLEDGSGYGQATEDARFIIILCF